ncbi:MAG: TlpA family protein disulfide reductase [Flavobacteriaceae bacterium]|nr:TlpA family protein disulfide reductase [Flavobacteriaceae bacterium]
MRYYILAFLSILFFSCQKSEELKLSKGLYKAVLEGKDKVQMPFMFEVKNDSLLTIYNAEEKIDVDEITYFKDSVKIQTPVFEAYITAKITNDTLIGNYFKPSMNRVVPFKAFKNNFRFEFKNKPTMNITGNWETVFNENNETERYIAKGIFKQKGNIVTGTFRTPTGDYRFLEGNIDGDSLKLSTFDGAHTFLFKAKITDSIMNGLFYSGNHSKEYFTAKFNNNYKLPNSDNTTYIKRGYNSFNFSFTDTRGRLISSSDPEFDNKITIVQIMGTWCPNCLDESKYLANYYKKNKRDVAIVALAFEIGKTREKAYKQINRFKDKVKVTYPVLLAQYNNEESKQKASGKLPMLNGIKSFPTTIFIDKNKKVRKIVTGFNGPATGEKYEEFKSEFESFVEKLIQE